MTAPFKNRKHAGIILGEILKPSFSAENVLVLGIPRGGIEVGFYVAQALDCEFSVIISKKLSYPQYKEIAFGAIAEDLSIFLTEQGKALPPETVMSAIDLQIDEIHKRVKLYREDNPLPEMDNKTVIIVDDGIATGSTIVPVISLCKKKNAKKIVVAAPVSGKNMAKEIYDLSDEVIIAIKPKLFRGVGEFYENFKQVSDHEVVNILNKNVQDP